MALRAVLVSPEFLFRVEQDPPAPRRTRRIASAISNSRRASRSSCGAAFPTTNCSTLAAAGKLTRPGMLERQVRRMLADQPLRGSGEQLRRPVAVPAQSRFRTSPTCAIFPDFDDNLRQAFRRETELLLRERHARRPQRSRPAARQLHVPQRAPREALRDPEHLRQPLPPRRLSTATASRGGLLRQGSILTVTSYADTHLAGDPRQMDSGQYPRHSAASAAAVVPALKEHTTAVGKSLSMRERMARAPRQPGLRRLPQADGPGRLLARELRRGRPLAHGSRTASRSTPPAGCPTAASSTASPDCEQALLQPARVVRRHLHAKSC